MRRRKPTVNRPGRSTFERDGAGIRGRSGSARSSWTNATFWQRRGISSATPFGVRNTLICEASHRRWKLPVVHSKGKGGNEPERGPRGLANQRRQSVGDRTVSQTKCLNKAVTPGAIRHSTARPEAGTSQRRRNRRPAPCLPPNSEIAIALTRAQTAKMRNARPDQARVRHRMLTWPTESVQ